MMGRIANIESGKLLVGLPTQLVIPVNSTK